MLKILVQGTKKQMKSKGGSGVDFHNLSKRVEEYRWRPSRDTTFHRETKALFLCFSSGGDLIVLGTGGGGGVYCRVPSNHHGFKVTYALEHMWKKL